MKQAIVLLSGGLDSITALAISRQFYEPTTISFDYGQKHRYELQCAEKIARIYSVPHRTVKIDSGLFLHSALTDSSVDVPKERAIDESIPVTYVPARNLLFLAHATALGESIGASDLFIGANALDYSGYPDCRDPFLRSFEQTANLGTKAGTEGRSFHIHAPLISMTKAQIIQKGMSLGVDYSLTSSCYDPGANGEPCRQCDSCQLREKGFHEAGVADPLLPLK